MKKRIISVLRSWLRSLEGVQEVQEAKKEGGLSFELDINERINLLINTNQASNAIASLTQVISQLQEVKECQRLIFGAKIRLVTLESLENISKD